MKRTHWSLGLAAAIAIATVLAWQPCPANAGDKLTVSVALPTGAPAPSGTDVEFLDSLGKAGTCSFVKLGMFSCNTTGAAPPSLLLTGGTLFGYSESLTGTATTETLKILSPTSFTGNDFFGKTVKFTYALPLTFLVNRQFATGVECSGSQTKTLPSTPAVLSPGATSVKFKTDKILGGEPIIGAEYNLNLRALGGPEIKARYLVGTTCSF